MSIIPLYAQRDAGHVPISDVAHARQYELFVVSPDGRASKHGQANERHVTCPSPTREVPQPTGRICAKGTKGTDDISYYHRGCSDEPAQKSYKHRPEPPIAVVIWTMISDIRGFRKTYKSASIM